ncbi:MAG TPA: PAS domain-containing protein [Povalibacter sp.]|uniref:hybrid sensor histidine kinase/response regulator n=1 Tax=Povalibacter sp. TaxID=1962978 RepID=UPI002C4D3446|nr:PAS domain-containing protein [Povalibacter sp.]HMN44014.1 PAS domain-containing protein [Povalibacter sp.]
MKKELPATLRFVLLEDNANDAELIQLELARNGVQVDWTHVASKQAFLDALRDDAKPPDLILADYTLPGFDGLAALKLVLEWRPDVPFIFVSGSLGEERAIEALKSGATDYVLKDRLQRLPAVVNRALTEARERRERRQAEVALEEQRLLLGTLIDSLPEIVYAVDTQSRLTVVNRALLDTLRKKREAVIGRRLSEVWPEETIVEIETQAESIFRTGRTLTDQERAWITPDGAVRWFTFTQVPLRDHNTVVGLVCTVREITNQKALEQEILEISNREQRRLGSDLHDGLGQELTGLSLLLKGLEMQLAREAQQYSSQVTKISDLLAHAIQSTRSLARGLAPVNLERGGLPEALKHLAVRCTDLYSLECSFTSGAQKLPELEEGAATHLYRIAQEATTNAARYARATTVAIDLRATGRKLQLSIADNGIGLSAGLAQGRPGMGLKIMEYRARMLGGTISFEEPGQGTRIVLSAPLHLLRRAKESSGKDKLRRVI